jgi:hypothetical protein
MKSTLDIQPAIPVIEHNPVLRPLRHLVRAVWLQVLRRNEIWVVAILLGLYALGALVLRIVGIESAQTARFITGLGLQLGSVLTSLLVIVMAGRLLPLEVELRTIYPVLAKPVTRAQILLGKALPTWLSGVAALLLFSIATLAITPHLPYQHPWALAQALILKSAALVVLTVLVLWFSLWLPAAVAMLVTVALYFIGPTVVNMVVNHLPIPGAGKLSCLVPDFALLDHFQRYVDGGGPLGYVSFAGLLLYAAIWSLILWGLANRQFRRMTL